MTTDYDPIADQYRRAKQQPWRGYLQSSSVLALIGDPTAPPGEWDVFLAAPPVIMLECRR